MATKNPGRDAAAGILAALDAGRGAPASGTRAVGDIVTASLAAEAERQQVALDNLAQSGKFKVTPNPGRFIGAGNEHQVELSENGSRVLKHTIENKFGVTVGAEPTPMGMAIDLREATATEYLDRLRLANLHLQTDFRVEGISWLGEHASLTVSQQFYRGEHPSLAELESFLKAAGFVKLKPGNILNQYAEDKI